MGKPDELADYLLDNYGVCGKSFSDGDCDCLKPGAAWLGRGCSFWKPCGATTYDQLEEAMRIVHVELAKKSDARGNS